MKFKLKNIAFLLLASTALTSCLPEDKTEYKDETLVEIKNPTLGMLTAVLNTRGIVTAPAAQVQGVLSKGVLINTRTADTILVQLVGPQKSTPVTVTYSVAGTGTNPAVEGTHYNFATAGARTVTIPANSSVGYLIVRPVANSIATVGDIRTFSINLVSANDAKVSPNYATFAYSLKR